MNRLFWSKPNNLFVLIRQYSTLFDLLWRIMSNYLFWFISFWFVLRFQSPLFWFISIRLWIQTLYIQFGHELNHKKHYSPKLNIILESELMFNIFWHSCFADCEYNYYFLIKLLQVLPYSFSEKYTHFISKLRWEAYPIVPFCLKLHQFHHDLH